ncbi:MAG: hypothetical protein AAF171_11925 [Cyanobacteria bacterium P01_A01_bin.116]
MTNPANETFGQARQGSVAAIIQVLNERLADIGIRTRAVVAEGVLQLLCEAATPEQLEKTLVIDRVRNELETISPQRIKKVKINSRIVKEEQLLWLEEINRDPENALLWAEMITLKRPFFVQRWLRDRNLKPAGPILKDISEPDPSESTLSTKVAAGSGLALLILGAGWLFRNDLAFLRPAADGTLSPEAAQSPSESPVSPAVSNNISGNISGGDRTADLTPQSPPPASETITQVPNPSTTVAPLPATSQSGSPAETVEVPADSATPSTTPSTETSSTETPPTEAAPPPASNNSGAVADAFAEAVRLATQAADDGQTATTAAQWLDLAARWQRASDLMSDIPEGAEQYAIAQDRAISYKTNSEAALAKASNVE